MKKSKITVTEWIGKPWEGDHLDEYEIRHRGRWARVKLRQTATGHWKWSMYGGLRDMVAHSPTQYGTREQALDAAVEHFQKHRGWMLPGASRDT